MDFSALMAKEITKKQQRASQQSGSGKIIKKSEVLKKREEEYREKQEKVELERAAIKRKKDEERAEELEKDRERKAKFVKRLKKNGKDADDVTKVSREDLVLRIKELDGEFKDDGENDQALEQVRLKLERAEQLKKELQEETDTDFSILAEDIRNDKDKVYIQMRAFLKYILFEWQNVVDKRQANQDEDDEKTSRTTSSIFNEVTTNLQPLFGMLRAKSLSEDMFPTLATLLMYLQQKRYQQANDTYISLSIGNSAWPIGVMAVGIHERSALSKIAGIGGGSKDVANVAKDEKTRKWIMSIKRLITFSEGYLSE